MNKVLFPRLAVQTRSPLIFGGRGQEEVFFSELFLFGACRCAFGITRWDSVTLVVNMPSRAPRLGAQTFGSYIYGSLPFVDHARVREQFIFSFYHSPIYFPSITQYKILLVAKCFFYDFPVFHNHHGKCQTFVFLFFRFFKCPLAGDLVDVWHGMGEGGPIGTNICSIQHPI